MKTPPPQLDGANVVCFVVLNRSHRQRELHPPEWLDQPPEERGEDHRRNGPTAGTPTFISHYVDGEPMRPVPALAIAQYAGEEDRSAYLFYCNEEWGVVQDDQFSSVEEALQQAGVQYEGLRREDWQWTNR
jgi:hypothetical protein